MSIFYSYGSVYPLAGGFVRWTLVPLHLSDKPSAHDAGAFEWGCFRSGLAKCTPQDKETHCGGDKTGSSYRATVRIPTNIADGEYMLGWSWFGGYAARPRTRTLFERSVATMWIW